MARVTLTIHHRRYDLICEEGQESYLASLASVIDRHIHDILRTHKDLAKSDEIRLLLMAALMLADENTALRKKSTPASSGSDDHSASPGSPDRSASPESDDLHIRRIAKRITDLAARINML